MRLDRSLAEAAVARFAGRLGMTPDEAAESIVRVAVSNMYAEFTKILSRAAVDPRDFSLVAFGGAGPVVGRARRARGRHPRRVRPALAGHALRPRRAQRRHRERRGADGAHARRNGAARSGGAPPAVRGPARRACRMARAFRRRRGPGLVPARRRHALRRTVVRDRRAGRARLAGTRRRRAPARRVSSARTSARSVTPTARRPPRS